MTTPAHCTRTDPHWSHPVHWVTNEPGIEWCPGVPALPPRPLDVPPPPPVSSGARPSVEPPADVAATSDPRLDVVIRLVHEELCLGFDDREVLTTMWAAMPHTIDMCRDAVEDWDAAHVVFSAEAPCTTAEQQLACPWRWAYNDIRANERARVLDEVQTALREAPDPWDVYANAADYLRDTLEGSNTS